MNVIEFYDVNSLYPSVLTNKPFPKFTDLPKSKQIYILNKIAKYNTLLLCINKVKHNANHKLWLPIEIWKLIGDKLKKDIIYDYMEAIGIYFGDLYIQQQLFQEIYTCQRNF